MESPINVMAAFALPTRTLLNPKAPRGALAFRPRDVAYVVEAPNSTTHGNGRRLWVVTSDAWIPGWEVNRRARLATSNHVVEVLIKGIMDFGTATSEGFVPSLRLPHWRVEKPSRSQP